MDFWPYLLLASLEGAVMAAVLALMALGLSLVFGVMRIVNVAHGEFFMLGAVLAWWSRKRRGIRPGNEHRIQVLASRGIGPRHNVVLLEVGDHRLLIGTAPESLTTLADLSEIPSFSEQLAAELPERRADDDPTEILATLERLDA